MKTYPRGSEWRRWDLHVHTPETQKEDRYQGSTPNEKWDNFYDAISKYIGDGSVPERNISVIGITDYLSVTNYYKVLKDNRLPKSVEMILPNVELRVLPMSKSSPLNIHCIFSPDLSENEINARFFSKLKFISGSTSYNALKTDLIRLGKDTAGEDLDDVMAYHRGIDQFVMNIDDIRKVFNDDHELREKTIIVVANSGEDGASGIINHSDYFLGEKESQLDAVRRKVYKFSDLIFSSKEKDRNYFLGLGPDDPEEVKRKCGSIKGCIHGSDAHCLEKLFEPAEERYCWIKADPTFNGLKQILYEPETRIVISPLMPETKHGYQVIDRIEIGDEKVQDDPIPFNDHLTCIIGGKSTGKSLLLHNIANAIDHSQVEKKAKTAGIDPSGRNLQGVKVYWKDGSVSTIDQQSDHKMVYIPQTYLNRLSDENEEITEIDKIISEIVLINENAKNAYNEMLSSLKSQKATVDRTIYDLIQADGELTTKLEKLTEIGTEGGIKEEIKKIKDQKNRLAESSSVSEEEIEKYDAAVEQVSTLQEELNGIENDKKIVNSLSTVVSAIDIDSNLTTNIYNKIHEAQKQAIETADNKWQVLRKEITDELDSRQTAAVSKKTALDAVISTIGPKIAENKTINNLTESLNNEEIKLRNYLKLKNEIDRARDDYDKLIGSLIQQFLQFRIIHKKYETVVNGIPEIDSGDLEFKVETPLRKEMFISTITELFDSRSLKSHKNIFDADNFDETYFDEEHLKSLIKACLNGDLKLLKHKTPEDGLRQIFIDWYNSTYSVRMDGDSISEMSPGKKALVLLKMLINMDENTCPILIDQPEDDLDNRSIFKELIPFIKGKKTQRQIIIVTHNANVVLGSDAEEIVVANQNGKNSPNKQFRFEYRTGAIEEDRSIQDATDVLGKSSIQKHICDILEGGKEAFDLRKHKYQI